MDLKQLSAIAANLAPAGPQTAPAPMSMAPRQDIYPDPTFQQRLVNFGTALQGGTPRDFNKERQTVNETFNFLVRQGLGEDDAKAIVTNPSLMKQVLPSLLKGGDNKYGKTGSIFQGPDGGFYIARWGEDGTHKIEPAAVDGKPLVPSKGVMQVGDTLVDKSTGGIVRNVGPSLAAEKIAEGEGANVAKIRADMPQAKARLGMVTDSLDRLENTARNLAQNSGLGRVVGGLWEAYAPNVSQGARNAGTELENLKVKISGAVLQAMRDASKTGGAVGQVTEREWPRLENMISNLDPRQGQEQFMRNLQEIITYTQSVKSRLTQAYEEDAAKAGMGGPTAPAAPRQAMPDPLGIRGQ